MSPKDPNTFSNVSEVVTEHLHLDLAVDFDTQTLSGSAILELCSKTSDPLKEVVLDTDFLDIKEVQLVGNETKLKFQLDKRDENFGSALHIDLSEVSKTGERFKLEIKYKTTKEGGAIQWLEPSQTLGKKHPYLFSQCQAIYARSMVPCQDTPGLKFTYTANITVFKELVVLMSALSTGSEERPDSKKLYKFEQKVSIPSYLLAIAVGNLASKPVSDRSAVWCEPEQVEAAAYEFADTEKFMEIAESLTCPYVWSRYDLLILPPSFPYGGMENPCLSFVTPTLLAGDRSAVDVVAHELAHSWTGNLVTTASWEHFWLNEGWTMFLERKIMGRMHGEANRQFSATLGLRTLEKEIEFFGKDNPLTKLCPDLEGVNPDDAFSTVPYEKGFNFLYYIEQLLGGPEVFEPYMKAHLINFAHKSISTQDWKSFLYSYMDKTHGSAITTLLDSIDWDAWLYTPGMLPVYPHFDDTLSKACSSLAKRWEAARNQTTFDNFDSKDYEELNPNQQVVFLEYLASYDKFLTPVIVGLSTRYHIGKSTNSEIKLRWQLLCLKSCYEAIYPDVVEFITSQGRMKYVRPLYRALSVAPNGNDLAKSTFRKFQSFYHPIAAKMIEKDLFGN